MPRNLPDPFRRRADESASDGERGPGGDHAVPGKRSEETLDDLLARAERVSRESAAEWAEENDADRAEPLSEAAAEHLLDEMAAWISSGGSGPRGVDAAYDDEEDALEKEADIEGLGDEELDGDEDDDEEEEYAEPLFRHAPRTRREALEAVLDEEEESIVLADESAHLPPEQDRDVSFGVPETLPEGAKHATVIAMHGRQFFALADGDREDDEGDDAGAYRVALARRLLIQKRWYKHPVAVGDRVTILPAPSATERVGQLLAIHPRRTFLARTATSHRDKGGGEQIVAANVDLLVITLPVPAQYKGELQPFRTHLIDRFLVAAARGEVEQAICINKIDLPHDDEDLASVIDLYGSLGVPVVCTSALTGEGVEKLRALLVGKTTVIAGLSGVGKSSLLNAISPGLRLRVSRVNQKTGKGRHTTSAATRHRLDLDAAGDDAQRPTSFVIDTPGIREFGFADLRPQDVHKYFAEIDAVAGSCAFTDCQHAPTQDGCAVLDAVEDGRIDARRYVSYRALVESLNAKPRPRRGR